MQRSDDIAELAAALAKAQAAMANPGYNSTNPHLKNRYASLAAVRDAVIPVLATHGIATTQLLEAIPDALSCTTVLWHTSGQWISNTLTLPVAQATPQGYGSTITYARRYGLMALLVVAGDEDDDGERGQTPPRRAETTTRPTRPGTVAETQQDLADRAALMEQITTTMSARGITPAQQRAWWHAREQKYGNPLPLNTLWLLADAIDRRGREQEPTAAPSPANSTSPPPRESIAWDTLRAHQDDAELPPWILTEIATALADAKTPESTAQALAGTVLDSLNAERLSTEEHNQ